MAMFEYFVFILEYFIFLLSFAKFYFILDVAFICVFVSCCICYLNKSMLLAGWEVRRGKNCDRGLENAARGRRPRAAFSCKPEVTVFPYTDLPAGQ